MEHQPRGFDQESALDALDVLQSLPQWRLTQDRWTRVADVLETMDIAVAASDDTTMRAATLELGLSSPVRVTRIGAQPAAPPPPPVLEISNRLVHTLLTTVERATESRNLDDGQPRSH